MKEITLDDLKNDYGEAVLNLSLRNLLQIGKKNFENTTLREEIQNLTSYYDNLEKQNKKCLITRELALQILNCEFKLCEFDDLELLTYFSNNKKEN